MVNTVVMLRSVNGGHAIFKKIFIPTISKIHDFKFTENGAIIQRCSKIEDGLDAKITPIRIITVKLRL
jgi:hypothetical protein